mmetsp:Transcript_93728/g.303514  ORF Transcript_93728/g.303514 Transcript_93728/m.303514 type:complete len:253 (+) Transcript_93728:554-1312(+)
MRGTAQARVASHRWLSPSEWHRLRVWRPIRQGDVVRVEVVLGSASLGPSARARDLCEAASREAFARGSAASAASAAATVREGTGLGGARHGAAGVPSRGAPGLRRRQAGRPRSRPQGREPLPVLLLLQRRGSQGRQGANGERPEPPEQVWREGRAPLVHPAVHLDGVAAVVLHVMPAPSGAAAAPIHEVSSGPLQGIFGHPRALAKRPRPWKLPEAATPPTPPEAALRMGRAPARASARARRSGRGPGRPSP